MSSREMSADQHVIQLADHVKKKIREYRSSPIHSLSDELTLSSITDDDQSK